MIPSQLSYGDNLKMLRVLFGEASLHPYANLRMTQNGTRNSTVVLAMILTFILGVVTGREWLKYEIRSTISTTLAGVSERLSGNDRPSPGPAAAPGAIPAPTPGWTVDSSSSAMDDSRTILLRLAADSAIQAWPSRSITPTLLIRCKERSTDVYFSNETRAAVVPDDLESGEVRLRFDDGPARRVLWGESTSGDALFAPNAVRVARQIAKAKRLVYQFTPFNSSPATTTFTLVGADTLVPKVAALCGWKM